MSLGDAIRKVLDEAGAPLHSRDIAERALQQGLWQTTGQTPVATVAAHLYTAVKKHGAAAPYVLVSKGVFAINPEAPAAPAATTASGTTAIAPESVADQAPDEPSSSGAAGGPAKKRLSFVDAAEDVLRRHASEQPMHYRDITARVLEEELVKTSGKTPEATLYAQVITENGRADKHGQRPRFVRHGKGMVGLTEWLGAGVHLEIAKHNAAAEAEMLAKLRELDPADFEQLVGELLRALGIRDVEVTAYHGDKGIDATGIHELAPGLEVRIAVQAKRQQQNVQAPVVRELNGGLKPHQQGLIITTSDFGKGARDEAARDDKPLIWLINGQQLVQLLIRSDIGARRVPVELVEPTGFDIDTSGD